jgi:hypothetical protein
MDITLRRGERLQLNWASEGKYYGIYEDFGERHKCPNGPHSHIFHGLGTEHTTLAGGAEKIIDPANWPWVKNYYKPCDNPACPFHKLPVKWYGNGRLTYEPNLQRLENFRDGLYSWGSFRNITVGGNKDGEPSVRPAQPNQPAWLTFRIDTPYVIADATIEARFMRASPSDECAIQISTDKGDTWREIWRSAETGENKVAANIGQTPWKANEISAVSQYSYLVRVEIKAADAAKTGLDWLKITSDLELNMFTLPMLQPGENRIQFSAKSKEPDDKLRVTFCWDDRAGAERKDARDITGLKDEYIIKTNARAPDDITMRYLLMENLGGR